MRQTIEIFPCEKEAYLSYKNYTMSPTDLMMQ